MPELTIEQMGEMSRGEIDKYNAEREAEIRSMAQIVPIALTTKDASPLKIVVPGDKTTTVDVAEHAE